MASKARAIPKTVMAHPIAAVAWVGWIGLGWVGERGEVGVGGAEGLSNPRSKKNQVFGSGLCWFCFVSFRFVLFWFRRYGLVWFVGVSYFGAFLAWSIHISKVVFCRVRAEPYPGIVTLGITHEELPYVL